VTLQLGTSLGPYEITGSLGAGGMGEVYRATDTNLKRAVAVKVLPASVAADRERIARFQREAEVLASLNHPNIAAVYGLERSDGMTALVMELVDGPTLADRIAQGRIPVDEALPIAKQIAEALEAAHEQGIIHRDLKPANVKVRPDGTVKVLDFGLAKALEPMSPATVETTASPTITSPAMMTGVGMLLGTAAYMSPEQARGKTVDKRSDIWAFGCVLYEILTGKPAFPGDEVSDVLASVLAREPDWTLLPRGLSPVLGTFLKRCLHKDRKQRIGDAQSLRLALDGAFETATPQVAMPEAATRPASRRALPWMLTSALAVGLVVALGLWGPWRTVQPAAPVRVESMLGVDASLAALQQGVSVTLSPDGRMFAFVAQTTPNAPSQLYIRRLDQLQATAVIGTEGAFGPFFSPDGQWIAFFANGKLRKVAASGGAVVTLCDAPNGRGGSWSEDGTITFRPLNTTSDGGKLFRVSSAGGMPEPLMDLGEGELAHRFPQVLPGGKGVLYSTTALPGDVQNATIAVQPLPAGTRRVLVRGALYGRYLSSGHLLYVRDRTLFAAPFDIDRLELTGEPAPLLEGVASSSITGAAQFAVSESGTIVYASGETIGTAAGPINWMDRSGKTTTLRAQAAVWSNPAFAPDGQRLALDIIDGRQTDVWVYEWARDTLSRLTFDTAAAGWPLWTPDGQRIVFGSSRADKRTVNLYGQRADGAGDVQRLTESGNAQLPGSWHPSGQFLAYVELVRGSPDVMILPMEGDDRSGRKPAKPEIFLNTPATEYQPNFSPDGKWLAYTSNESGRNEVYVRPFPGPGGKWQISTDGGGEPLWSRTRPELFYVVNQRIMVTTYSDDGDSFNAGKPQRVSDATFMLRQPGTTVRNLDLHPDGQRFAVAPALDESRVRQDKVVFIFNFFDELKRLVPVN
jgi:serine/threonine-protein kinase